MGGRPERSGVVLEVLQGHQTWPRYERGAGSKRQVMDRVHDVAADRAAVQGSHAVAPDLDVRPGEVRIAQARADDRKLTVRKEQVARRRELGEPVLVLPRDLPECVVDDEPPAGDSLGWAKVSGEAEAAEAIQGLLPGHQRSGNANRESARDRSGERQGLARRWVDEEILGGACWRLLPAVDRRHASGPGVVVD